MVKKIPCRICGTMFEPCASCQASTDTFKWRNFACSIECAKKYIREATEYRERKNKKITTTVQPITENKNDVIEEYKEIEQVDEKTIENKNLETKVTYKKKKEFRKTDEVF